MEVAVIGLRGLPEVIGGIERHCASLYPRLAARLPELHFRIYTRAQFSSPAIRQYQGLELYPLRAPNIRRVEAFVHTLVALLHARFRTSARIVHIHGIGPNFWAPLARLLGFRVISTHHGQDYKRLGMSALARAILKSGEVAAARYADRLIAVSQPVTADLSRRFPRCRPRIRWIPNGFEPLTPTASDDPAAAALLASLGLTAGRYVLTVGRIDPGKDIGTLIDAFQRSGIDGKLLIVGSAHHQDDYAAGLRAMAGPNVVFAGFRTSAELVALYSHASLFVLPSLHEGFSVSILEAISCGTPLLVSDIEANRAMALHAENYFPTGNVAALAEALRQPHTRYRFDDPDFAARFSWDTIAHETADLYQTLLGRNAPTAHPANPDTDGAGTSNA